LLWPIQLEYFLGKMAWSKKLEEELSSDGSNADRDVRQARTQEQYVPTFFTGQQQTALPG
jgi:hypothetical protein